MLRNLRDSVDPRVATAIQPQNVPEPMTSDGNLVLPAALTPRSWYPITRSLNAELRIASVENERGAGLATDLAVWPGGQSTLSAALVWTTRESVSGQASDRCLDVELTGQFPENPDAVIVLQIHAMLPSRVTGFIPLIVSTGIALENPADVRFLHVQLLQKKAIATTSLHPAHYSQAMMGALAIGGQGRLSLKLTLGITDMVRESGRLAFSIECPYVGTAYDPAIHDPRISAGLIAYEYPTADAEVAADVLGDFSNKSTQLLGKKELHGTAQQLIPPFIYQKTGETANFTMLIGNINALVWYGVDHAHGLDFYSDLGVVRPGDVVFDCGAHTGMVATYFATIAGPNGKVLTFDPFEQNNLQIEANAALNGLTNVEVVRGGVGAQTRTVYASNANQTLRDMPGDGDTAISEIALDDLIDRNPTLIKLDVEGYDIFALRGAREIAKQAKTRWFVEYHTQFLRDQGLNPAEIFEIITPDLYDIEVALADSAVGYQPYKPGVFDGLTSEAYIYAVPKGQVRPA